MAHIESHFDEEKGCARFIITSVKSEDVQTAVDYLTRYWEEKGNYKIETMQPKRPVGGVYEAFMRVTANPTVEDIP